jgi:hypothetical protein
VSKGTLADSVKYERDLWARLGDRGTWAKTAAEAFILASSSEALIKCSLQGFDLFRQRAAIAYASQEFTLEDFQTMYDLIVAEAWKRGQMVLQ